MRSKIIKITAGILSLLFCLSAAGCSDTSWAVKVNGASVPAGVYISYLLSYRSEVLSNYSSSSSSSEASSSNPLDVTAPSSSSSSSSASTDPWSTKIEGVNAKTWTINKAVDACKQLGVIEGLCKQRKISLTSDEQATVSNDAKTDLSQYSVYKDNGVSQSSLERILAVNYYLNAKLFDSYFAKGGEKEVAVNDIKTYYSKNFVHIKQIFFNKYDSSGNELSSTDQTKKKNQANDVLKKVLADKTKFDSLVKTYNEDPGMTSNPEGYTFDKTANYLQDFIDTAYSMKVGDVKLIETEEGWHIMYKQPVDTSSKTFTATMQETALQSMKSDDFMTIITEAMDKAKLVRNQNTINKFYPDKLKDS